MESRTTGPVQAAPAQGPAPSRQEALLDAAIEETFPASDPISPMILHPAPLTKPPA
jgi:hypothetical protein